MRTLEQIKNEYSEDLAKSFSRNFSSWEEMMDTDFEYGLGISKLHSVEDLMDEVAKRYATEAVEERDEQFCQSLLNISLPAEAVKKVGEIINTKIDLS